MIMGSLGTDITILPLDNDDTDDDDDGGDCDDDGTTTDDAAANTVAIQRIMKI